MSQATNPDSEHRLTGRRLLTLSEAAEFFGIPRKSLYAQRSRGEFPGSLGFRVGKYVRFDPRRIEEWMINVDRN